MNAFKDGSRPHILVVAGHPDAESYSHALARAYTQAAEAEGASVTLLDLATATFDPVLRKGYREKMPLDPFITDSQFKLMTCDHLTLVFPIWWSAEPSLLKGWFERVLAPGVAYRYSPGKASADKLLAGRTATLITSSHGPAAWTRLPLSRVKHAVLGYCGVKVRKQLVLGGMEGMSDTPERRHAFLAKVAQTARKDARPKPSTR